MHRRALVLLLLVGCGSSSLSKPDAREGLSSDAQLDALAPITEVDALAPEVDALAPEVDALAPEVDALAPDTEVDALAPDALVDGPSGTASPDAAAGADEGGDEAPPASFPEATLIVSPTAFAFSMTAVGVDSAPEKFTVSNIGLTSTGPISHVIEGSSEFAITASTCGQPLAFGSTCAVEVTFRPAAAGTKTARLTVWANPGKVFSTLLSGTAQPPAAAQLTPTSFDFPPVVARGGASQIQEFTVSNTGAAPLGPPAASIKGRDSGDFAIANDSCAGGLLQPNASCDLGLIFVPSSAGIKSAMLVVSLGTVDLVATLSGTGVVPGSLLVTPASQPFGFVRVGTTSSARFQVTNTGGAPTGKLDIIVEGTNAAEFTAKGDASCVVPLDPGVSCGITVAFTPAAPGAKAATLRVAATPGGFATVDLTGTGVPATQGDLTLTAPSPNPFGTVVVGGSSAATFVVKNTGTATFGMVMANIAGTNSNEFTVSNNACAASLPPAGTCEITVKFQPAVVGNRTAVLQVSASPGGFATLQIGGSAH
jgi:hypothetical protein